MSQIKQRCTLNEMRKLEVINVCNGKRMGCVADLEFDLCMGQILAILVPKRYDLNDLFCKKDKRFIRIPWCNIDRIGDDIILVRLETSG